MGIREEKKRQYRDKILKAAKEIFQSQGYEATTIEQIAKKAGVGLGTAYNYFKSKDELFVLSLVDDIADSTEVNPQINSTDKNVTEIISNEIMPQIEKLKVISKRNWKIAFPILLNAMKSDRFPVKVIMRADYKMMEKIRDLLKQLKDNQLLDAEFNIDTAVDLIFGALFFNLAQYIYTSDITFEHICERIRADIGFIFQSC